MATTPKLKTTAKIRTTFEKMLETTPMDEISVTDLCKAADINRATFYYHYDSVAAVYAEIEKNMESEFRQFMLQGSTAEKSFYVTFFEFVARNANMCRLIVNSPRTGKTFLNEALEAGRARAVADITKLYHDCPAYKIEYYYLFVSNGFLGLMSYWLNSGMKESPEEIASIGESLSQRGIMYLV